MNIEQVRVADLVPYARNSRTHSAAQVAKLVRSIEEFGFNNPVLIDGDGVLIAGHGRTLAAQKLQLEEVPAIRLTHLSEDQRRAFVIADNRIAEDAGWNDELLKSELAALSLADFDMKAVGLEDDELARILGASSTVGRTAPDDVPEPTQHVVSKLGDVWLCGPHRVRCGDSTSDADVAALLAGARPNLMVTDPPYGVDYDPAWRQRAGLTGAAATGKVANDDRADWRATWRLFTGNVAYVWHGGLHGATVAESLAVAKFKVRAQIVWVKTRPVISRGHYHWQHEPAFYAVREGEDDAWQARFDEEFEPAYYAVRDGETADWHGDRKQRSVWMIENLKNDTGHSMQKPVECMRRPMLNNSSVGDRVYEPFGGSGSTLIAAEQIGRIALVMELMPNYVDLIVRRWQAFKGAKATRESDGATFDSLVPA
jgi:DNA modification methylase